MKEIWRRLIPILRTGIGLGLLVYLGLSGTIDWSALMGLAQVWTLSLLALGLLFVAACGASWRVCLLMRPHDLYLSLSASIRLMLIGLFFNTCLPGGTGGDVVRIYYATGGNQGRRLEIVTIFLFDRAIGLCGLLLLPLLLAPFFRPLLVTLPGLRGLLWITSAGAVALLSGIWLCVRGQRFRRHVIDRLLGKLPQGQYVARMLDTLSLYRSHRLMLVSTLGLSIAIHISVMLTTLTIAQVTTPTGARAPMALLIPLGFVANGLPLTPGGLGVGEAAFDQLFQMVGLTGGAIVILGWRMLSLLLGLPGLVFYIFAKKQVVLPQTSVSGL
jgi:hypothetical protein